MSLFPLGFAVLDSKTLVVLQLALKLFTYATLRALCWCPLPHYSTTNKYYYWKEHRETENRKEWNAKFQQYLRDADLLYLPQKSKPIFYTHESQTKICRRVWIGQKKEMKNCFSTCFSSLFFYKLAAWRNDTTVMLHHSTLCNLWPCRHQIQRGRRGSHVKGLVMENQQRIEALLR